MDQVDEALEERDRAYEHCEERDEGRNSTPSHIRRCAQSVLMLCRHSSRRTQLRHGQGPSDIEIKDL